MKSRLRMPRDSPSHPRDNPCNRRATDRSQLVSRASRSGPLALRVCRRTTKRVLARDISIRVRRGTYCITLKQVVVKAGKAQLAQSMDSWVQWLEGILLFLGQIAFAHGKCKVWRALVDIELARSWAHFLYSVSHAHL